MTIQHYLRNYKEFRIIIFFGIVSFVFIIISKGIIRPLHFEFSKVTTILLGVLPNFFAASGFSAFMFVYSSYFLFKKKISNLILKALFFSMIVPLTGLIVWEYMQFAFWQSPTDHQDIIASVFGSAATVILVLFLTRNMKKRNHIHDQLKFSNEDFK